MAISYVASGLLNTPAHVSPPLFALNRYSNGNTSQSTHVMNIRVQVMELLISPYNKSHVWIEGWLITERKKKKKCKKDSEQHVLVMQQPDGQT